MAGRTVAVFTAPFDVTTDCVIVELNRRGVPVFRCDPADFPVNASMAARFGIRWTGQLRTPHRSVEITDIGCAWWRRPGKIAIPEDTPERRWTQAEIVAGFRGLLSTLPWFNDPDILRAAEHKPRQLATAVRAGFQVPPTIITNDPKEAREFAEAYAPIIYKPLVSGRLDDGRMIYAVPVDADSFDDSLCATAHMFQQQVPKAYELRVTVVDRRIFVAQIDTHTAAGRQDWRSDYGNLRYSAGELPGSVRMKIRRFMRMMGLRFAAIDLVVTPDHDVIFLEANPNGQWAWIEQETGLPIASAIADALQEGCR